MDINQFKCKLKHIYRKTCKAVLKDISIETLRDEFMNLKTANYCKNPVNYCKTPAVYCKTCNYCKLWLLK